MENYREFITYLSQNKIDRIFLNSDVEHAIEVFIKLFETANDTIRIYAACLSNEVTNDPRYIKALSDFIEKDGHLKILLNNFVKEKVLTSNLFKRLAYYVDEKRNIEIKTTKAKFYRTDDTEKKEIHFTVVDSISYRLETDIEKRTAVCNFNSEVIAKDMVAKFDDVFNHSKNSVDLKELFK